MRFLGLEISRTRTVPQDLSPLYNQGVWTSILNTVQEPFTGAWQRNIIQDRPTLLSFSAVYCCVTGIASDIAKLRLKLSRNNDGIWTEITEKNAWLPLLKKPNGYQVCLKFIEQWILSKLLNGNTYVLKERDGRGVVNELYVLDPCRVKPLIATNGDVYYQLGMDNLRQVFEDITVPASEIIHDSMPGLFHPLIGTSPLYACAASVGMGDAIQANSQNFFKNRSLPGGMLTAPGRISDETAKRLKAEFESKFSGSNLGRLFVGGDGLAFNPFTMTAEQSDLVEQLKWSVGDVARAFHYPEYKLGGPLPPYSGNMQALTLSYYEDCLQPLIESAEAHLDDGLALPADMGTEFDLDNLLRMDTKGQAESVSLLAGTGVMKPNEGRKKFDLPPVDGGDTPYLQQQNYSLAALAKRDAQADPFASKTPTAPTTPPPPMQRESVEWEWTEENTAIVYGRVREGLVSV